MTAAVRAGETASARQVLADTVARLSSVTVAPQSEASQALAALFWLLGGSERAELRRLLDRLPASLRPAVQQDMLASLLADSLWSSVVEVARWAAEAGLPLPDAALEAAGGALLAAEQYLLASRAAAAAAATAPRRIFGGSPTTLCLAALAAAWRVLMGHLLLLPLARLCRCKPWLLCSQALSSSGSWRC